MKFNSLEQCARCHSTPLEAAFGTGNGLQIVVKCPKGCATASVPFDRITSTAGTASKEAREQWNGMQRAYRGKRA